MRATARMLMRPSYFKLEESADELLVDTRNSDFGIVVLVVDVGDYGADSLALAEEVARDSLAFWKQKFVVFVVEQQSLARPCLVYFAGDELAFEFFEFIVDSLFLEVENAALQRLTQIEDGSAAEVLENYFT